MNDKPVEIDKEQISTEILDVLVAIEKLRLKQKKMLKEAIPLSLIGLVIIIVGAYARASDWTTFPIFQAAIVAGGILLAIAFRPLQRCKSQLNQNEKRLQELESFLKKGNFDYTASVSLSKDEKGTLDVKKSIKLIARTGKDSWK
jgi:hypothetical protein